MLHCMEYNKKYKLLSKIIDIYKHIKSYKFLRVFLHHSFTENWQQK